MEKDLIERLRDGIQTGKLLPHDISARVIDQLLPTERAHADLLIEFTLNSKKQFAVIEFKSRLTPMLLEGAIHQVSRYTHALAAEERFQNAIPMVAAPYISESQRNRCKEVGVGYIDLNGTFFLRNEGVYIDVVRPATEFKHSQVVRNIFTGQSRRIIRVLLTKAHTPFRLERLAKEANLSTTRVFQVVRKLDEEQFILRASEGRILNRPARLLRLFAEEIRDEYRRNRTVFAGFSELSPNQIAQRIREYCSSRSIDHGFTLSSGLESHERNLREDVTAAYVGNDPSLIANELRIDAVGRGANVYLMRAPDVDNTPCGGVFYQPRNLSNGLPGINPIQIYLDFSMYSHRGQEQADFIMHNVLNLRS
jgi:hypothetical protein